MLQMQIVSCIEVIGIGNSFASRYRVRSNLHGELSRQKMTLMMWFFCPDKVVGHMHQKKKQLTLSFFLT